MPLEFVADEVDDGGRDATPQASTSLSGSAASTARSGSFALAAVWHASHWSRSQERGK